MLPIPGTHSKNFSGALTISIGSVEVITDKFQELNEVSNVGGLSQNDVESLAPR